MATSRNRRFYRKLLLVILAMAALVWVAMDQFGISRAEISELFLVVVLAAVVVIAAAALVAALWIALRRLLFRPRD